MLFQPLYLSFHLDSLHRNHDSPHFSHFHADSLHTHSNPILRISTLIHRISLILFSNSPFWLLQIACSVCIPSLFSLIYLRKIVALVQNEHFPYLQVHNSRHQIIYIVYDISVLPPKIIYLIVPQVKYLISVKCEQIICQAKTSMCFLFFEPIIRRPLLTGKFYAKRSQIEL